MTAIWNAIIVSTINKRSDIVKLWRTENSHWKLWLTSCQCKVIKSLLNSTTQYSIKIILHHSCNGFAAIHSTAKPKCTIQRLGEISEGIYSDLHRTGLTSKLDWVAQCRAYVLLFHKEWKSGRKTENKNWAMLLIQCQY